MKGKSFAYSRNLTEPNTFIGGLSGVVTNKYLLATRLGISPVRILGFKIIGSDIECRIVGSYDMPDSAGTLATGFGNTAITYFKDVDKLQKILYNWGFWNCTSLTLVELEGLEDIRAFNFRNSPTSTLNFPLLTNLVMLDMPTGTRTINIPLCVNLGATSGDDGVFDGIVSGSIINANTYLLTNNGGLPDGDLTYAIAQGATVNYI